MQGNFVYHNPTKIYFGEDSISNLKDELKNYGDNVLLIYGGGSIKKNGIYDAVTKVLAEAGKTVIEDAGVMPNPTIEKLREGVDIARKSNTDFILAVGGGSVCDYAKAVSISINEKEDPWEKYFVKFDDVSCDIVPVGCVLTMAGTGSEMNGGSVITNHAEGKKVGHVFGPNVFPKFSVLDPTYTYSLPKYQVVAGIYDSFNHICEQYFCGDDDNVSDYISEGLMRSIIHSSRIAAKNLEDYEARSNLMWDATWALNYLIGKGKSQDWEVHMIGQGIGAITDATHGMTLSAVSVAYYKYIMRYGLAKFVRFARSVFDVDPTGKTDEQVAIEGIDAMAAWANEIGCVMNVTDLGVTDDNMEQILDAVAIMQGGYKVLDRSEVKQIITDSMKK